MITHMRGAAILALLILTLACSGGDGDEGGENPAGIDLEDVQITTGQQPEQQQQQQQGSDPIVPKPKPKPKPKPSPTPTADVDEQEEEEEEEVQEPVDEIDPEVTGLSDDAVLTNAKSWTWGCSEADCEYRYLIDDQPTTSPAGAYGSTDTVVDNSSQGTIYLHVQAIDPAGNESAVVHVSAVLDTAAPSVPNSFALQSPAAANAPDDEPILRFSSLAGDEVIRVYGDADCADEVAVVTATGVTLDLTITLAAEGAYAFHATASDDLGNTSACSATEVAYTFDASINEISDVELIDPATSPGRDATPTVRISGVEAGDTVKLFDNGSCFLSGQIGFDVAAGATIDIPVDAGEFASDGTYDIYARSSDAAGNTSACSAASATYELDTDPPVKPSAVSLTDPATEPGLDTTPTFLISGLVSGNTVTLYTESTCDNAIGSGTAAGTTLSLDTEPLANDGTFDIYATTTDPAGNESLCSTATDSYSLDASLPELTSVRIESGGGKSQAGRGGDAIITFESSEPLQSQTVTILGNAATVTNIFGKTYRAVYTFNGSEASGLVTFAIDFADQAANAGVQVTATTDASSLTYDATDYAPILDVVDQTVDEQTLLSVDVNDTGTSDDTDGNGNSISYTCFYDNSQNGYVNYTQNCSALSGLSLVAASGALTWTPSYFQAGEYELLIVGSDGTIDGETVFSVTVDNVNRPPVLATIDNQTFGLGSSFNFNMYDTSSGIDRDVDYQTVTYTCYYDISVDGSVADTDSCTDIDGLNFNTTSGLLSWSVQPTTPGIFELKVSGTDGEAVTDEFFTALITIDISRLPQLSMVGSGTTSYIASLSNDNDVTLNGAPVDGGAEPTIYAAGDIFTVSTTAGDLLECSGGCYAITPIQGTAAWSTQTYSGTLLSTYMGRFTESRIVVAAFDQPATISIVQGSGVQASGSIGANSIASFDIAHDIGALWIESDAPISAYVSSSLSANYDQDGRVITAPAKEALGFVSGGGGTPSGISTTSDGTVVNAYRNDGQNFENQTIDIADILTVTATAEAENSARAAIAMYATEGVVSTQHADTNGTNSTPSLPRAMLSTHFVAPMTGDYASFASFDAGELLILDSSDTVILRASLTKDGTAHAKAPYAYSHNAGAGTFPAGTRFVCTTPCLGIFQPNLNQDETLMTGTVLNPMALTSTDFASGDPLPADFVGQRAAECSGDNDFPNLTWERLPWGTKSLALIVQNESNGDFVHLNLVDIDPTLGSLGKIEGAAGAVVFPSGTEGTNGYGGQGWSGPCDSAGSQTYSFRIYALSSAIGSAVDNTTTDSFETTYAASILGSATMTAIYGE